MTFTFHVKYMSKKEDSISAKCWYSVETTKETVFVLHNIEFWGHPIKLKVVRKSGQKSSSYKT